MIERDVMALLAEANPVRVDALPPLDTRVGDRIVARRRRPSRRIALVAAIALAALAAALIATFANGGKQSRPSVSSMDPSLNSMDSLFTPTVARPLPGAEVTLADASAAIGQPIVLPDTSLVSPSDAGPVFVSGSLPNVTAAITFPSQGVFVDYTLPPPPSAVYQEIAQENPHSFETVDLNGETALAVKQNSDDTVHNFGGVVFVLNGVEIGVFGHYDESTLQSVAQSIVDRTSASTPGLGGINLFPYVQPRKRITLDKASRTLGAPVVLPDSSLVQPSNVGKVWAEGKCPHPSLRFGHPSSACLIWVRFPSLALIYERPRPDWPRTRAQYEVEAMHMRHHGVEVVDLSGVPGFAINEQIDGRNPGSIDFVLNGTRIVVAGHQDEATLKAVAQSIVDRSRS